MAASLASSASTFVTRSFRPANGVAQAPRTASCRPAVVRCSAGRREALAAAAAAAAIAFLPNAGPALAKEAPDIGFFGVKPKKVAPIVEAAPPPAPIVESTPAPAPAPKATVKPPVREFVRKPAFLKTAAPTPAAAPEPVKAVVAPAPAAVVAPSPAKAASSKEGLTQAGGVIGAELVALAVVTSIVNTVVAQTE